MTKGINITYLLGWAMGWTLLVPMWSYTQESTTFFTADYPSHNQLMFNRFLVNPTFSVVRENKSYLSFFHRNQGAVFTDNRQDLFLGLTHKLNAHRGLGFNLYGKWEGVINTFGMHANYAHNLPLGPKTQLAFATNVSYINSGLDKGNIRFNDPDPVLDELGKTTVLSLQPGLNLSVGAFDVGFYAKDLLNYNTGKHEFVGSLTTQSLIGHLQYTHAFQQSRGLFKEARFMPLISFTKGDNTTLDWTGSLIMDFPKFGWLQSGYNQQYGSSFGFGINLNRHLSLGYVWEKDYFGQGQNLGANHEMSMAYVFDHSSDKGMGIANGTTTLDTIGAVSDGPSQNAKKEVEHPSKSTSYVWHRDTGKNYTDQSGIPKKRRSRKKDSLSYFMTIVEENKNIIDELILRQDSLEEARTADLERRFEMIMQLVETKLETHIETATENPALPPAPKVGQRPNHKRQKMRFQIVPHLNEGYYIVANVFKSRSNLFTFLNKLQEKGLSPDYFISNENGLNYVYLGYFVDAGKARNALENDFNGKYGDDKWILRVFNNSYTANTYQDEL